MKIGMIGAENSHTAAIAKIINVEKQVKGFSVDYVWGETQDFAAEAAKQGQIPNIVEKPRDMLGKVDAIVVDHRHPKYHLKAALPFIKEGIPAFIDKPFCYRVEEGKEFLETAKKHNTPVTSFSILPNQKSFKKAFNEIGKIGDVLAGGTYGPADLKSKYGGIFFYGIHQVELVLKAFGYNVDEVLVTKNGNGSTGQLMYSDGKIITMDLIKQGMFYFGITAVGSEKAMHMPLVFDESRYLSGTKRFCKMFKTGEEPEKYDNMLKPVAVLEALDESIKNGKQVKVKS